MQTATVAKQTSVDVLQSNAFTIQSSGKMFHMVMAGLYSDKPQSITREIWSNAYDAHAMCGKADVPFEVTFPTTFIPEFACRDFGEGISHADMQSLYTVLGHSSKENTNQAVGKWGVGRMSPMSYTDSFTVTSIHKGMKAIYNVMLDDDGNPKLHTFMEPTPTTEPSGVRISFPVDKKDIGSFQKAASRVSLGFDVKPIITNKANNLSWPTIEKTFEGNGFYFYKNLRMGDSYSTASELKGAFVKMGCVIYPIDTNLLTGSKAANHNVIIEVPIGSLGVSASRESLSYGRNEPTLATLKDQLALVEAEVSSVVEKDIASAKSPFHAYCLLQKYTDSVPRVYGNLSWKGVEISPYQCLSLNGRKLTIRKSEGKTLRNAFDVHTSARMYPRTRHAFVLLDVAKKKPVRFPARLSKFGVEHSIHVIEYQSTDPQSSADLANLLAEFEGGVEFVDAPALPDPGVQPTGKRGPVKVKVISAYGTISPIDMDDAVFKAGGVYVPIVGSAPTEDHKGYRHILKLVHDKCDIKVLYGINAVKMKDFKDQPQWITLKEYLTKFIDKNKDELALLDENSDSYLYRNHICHKLVGLGSKEIDDLSAAIKKADSNKTGLSASGWRRLQSFTGVTVVQQPSVDLGKLDEAVAKKFPLLYQVGLSTPIAYLIPYIKALA